MSDEIWREIPAAAQGFRYATELPVVKTAAEIEAIGRLEMQGEDPVDKNGTVSPDVVDLQV